jgi:hypothetical protein
MMLGEKYINRMIAAREEKEKETKPIHDFMRRFETHWQERKKQENKFRDRHFFLCEFLKIKDIKRDVDYFIDDFNTTEILDFYFYILNDDLYSMKLIVDKVEYADLVTIFKSGVCGGVTYSAIMYKGFSGNRQLQLIDDVKAAPEADEDEVKSAIERIIEVVKRLDSDGCLSLWD